MLMIDAIAAKSESHDSSIWLPFSIHAFDTAGIIERLFNKWLPDSVRKTLCESIALGSDVESREKMTSEYCRLLALLHDIGKLTPAFQSKYRSIFWGMQNCFPTKEWICRHVPRLVLRRIPLQEKRFY